MRPKPIIIFEILYCIMMSVGAWRSWMWLGDLNPTLPKTMLLATEIGMFLLVVSLVFSCPEDAVRWRCGYLSY